MVMELPPTRDNAPYHHIIDGHGFQWQCGGEIPLFHVIPFFFIFVTFFTITPTAPLVFLSFFLLDVLREI